MRSFTTLATASLTITTALLAMLPAATADHCGDLLGPAEWVCHPEPDFDFDLSECIDPCKGHTFYSKQPTGSGPGIWHIVCDVAIAGQTYRLDQVSAGDAPTCLTGIYVRTVSELVEPGGTNLEEGAALVNVKVGECELTLKAELYNGLGLNEDRRIVPCADFP